MKIYVFKSEVSEGLCAFAADEDGGNLPSQFAPWRADGIIEPSAQPPHNLSRIRIEGAIKLSGFQLWRLKRTTADRRMRADRR
jgi:hypothetical protein